MSLNANNHQSNAASALEKLLPKRKSVQEMVDQNILRSAPHMDSIPVRCFFFFNSAQVRHGRPIHFTRRTLHFTHLSRNPATMHQRPQCSEPGACRLIVYVMAVGFKCKCVKPSLDLTCLFAVCMAHLSVQGHASAREIFAQSPFCSRAGRPEHPSFCASHEQYCGTMLFITCKFHVATGRAIHFTRISSHSSQSESGDDAPASTVQRARGMSIDHVRYGRCFLL